MEEDFVVYRDTITIERDDGRGAFWWGRVDSLWFLKEVPISIVAVRACGLRTISIGERFLVDVYWGQDKLFVVRLFPTDERKERQ